MNPRYVRTMVDRLLADLERNPQLGRRRSFMGRYGRPLGFGLALGIGGAAGCGGGSSLTVSDAADAIVRKSDSLPPSVDAYGAQVDGLMVKTDTADAVPPAIDVYAMTAEVQPPVDTRDALPTPADAYGMMMPDVPPPADAYGMAMDMRPPVDTRDALPTPADAYGIVPDLRPPIDTRDALPPAVDVYAMLVPIDGGSVDGGQTG